MATERKSIMPIIRLIQPEDLSAVSAIEVSCSSQPWSTDELASHIAKAHTIHAVAESDTGSIAGFICCQCAVDEMEVYKLAVSAKWRRQGIGMKLMNYAIGQARLSGIRTVHLEVASRNAAAIGLYAKTGFVQTYRRKKYYAASGDDAVVMKLSIG